MLQKEDVLEFCDTPLVLSDVHDKWIKMKEKNAKNTLTENDSFLKKRANYFQIVLKTMNKKQYCCIFAATF